MSEIDDPIRDPKNYVWGLFYCNSDDDRIVVPKRFGFGLTLNFSKPYVLAGFLLFILSIAIYSFLI